MYNHPVVKATRVYGQGHGFKSQRCLLLYFSQHFLSFLPQPCTLGHKAIEPCIFTETHPPACLSQYRPNLFFILFFWLQKTPLGQVSKKLFFLTNSQIPFQTPVTFIFIFLKHFLSFLLQTSALGLVPGLSIFVGSDPPVSFWQCSPFHFILFLFLFTKKNIGPGFKTVFF